MNTTGRMRAQKGAGDADTLGLSHNKVTLGPGQRLGQYKLVSLLGAGGMGEVWRAHDPDLQRDVAIKVLLPTYAGDPARLRRFEREARAVAMLNHPNLLVVHAVGNQGGRPYLVTELLDGGSLRDHMMRPLPPRQAIDFTIEIARGLAAAHDRGLVHRDLKPENIFVTRTGGIKILDFGLAKLVQRDPASDPTLTETGMVLGTPRYMSPEQACGQDLDHRSDIFAAGAILFEMLSGRPAFTGDTPVAGSGVYSTDHQPMPR
jgi:serine/threonine protein kinase